MINSVSGYSANQTSFGSVRVFEKGAMKKLDPFEELNYLSALASGKKTEAGEGLIVPGAAPGYPTIRFIDPSKDKVTVITENYSKGNSFLNEKLSQAFTALYQKVLNANKKVS